MNAEKTLKKTIRRKKKTKMNIERNTIHFQRDQQNLLQIDNSDINPENNLNSIDSPNNKIPIFDKTKIHFLIKSKLLKRII